MGVHDVCNGVNFIEISYRTLHYQNKKVLNAQFLILKVLTEKTYFLPNANQTH